MKITFMDGKYPTEDFLQFFEKLVQIQMQLIESKIQKEDDEELKKLREKKIIDWQNKLQEVKGQMQNAQWVEPMIELRLNLPERAPVNRDWQPELEYLPLAAKKEKSLKWSQ